MRAIWIVARTEARLQVRRRGYWLLLSGFVVLAVVAGWLNRERQVHHREQQVAYQALVRAQWEAQPDRHPHRVAHYGTFAFKPPGPLAALDPGVESYAGRVQYLEAHRQNPANFPEAAELSSAFRLGELSLAFVLQALLPLVAIVLGHRVLADEREANRARLLLVQAADARVLVWGKLVGLIAALTPFILLGSSISALAAWSDAAWRADAERTLRLVGWLGTMGWLTLVWAAVAVLVSAWSRSNAIAFGVLVSAWVLGTVVVPRVAGAIASTRVALPDKSTFAAALAEEIRQHGDTHDPNDPHFARLRQNLLARYGVERVEDLPVNFGAVVMAEGEQISARIFAQRYAELAALMRRQLNVTRLGAWLAPSLAARELGHAIAGTGLSATLRFQQEAEAYRYAFVQALNTLHRDKIRYQNDRDQRLSAEHWRQIEDFRPTPERMSEALADTRSLWIPFFGWLVIPLVGLFWRKGGVA